MLLQFEDQASQTVLISDTADNSRVGSLFRTARSLRHRAAPVCAMILASALTLPAAAVPCPNLFDPPEPVTEESAIPGGIKMKGADADVKEAHLASRVVTDPYEGDVPSGQYAAVAADAEFFAEMPQNSSTSAANADMKAFWLELNEAVDSKQNTDYVIGHLVNHFFGGNFTDAFNFVAMTSRMNASMRTNGEKMGKTLLERIKSVYYEDHYSTKWVGRDARVPSKIKAYKPGILYETEVTDNHTVKSYEDDNGIKLIDDTRISDDMRDALPKSVRTKIRFILHEFEFDSRGRNPKPNGKWFNMPQDVFEESLGANGEIIGLDWPDAGSPAQDIGTNGLDKFNVVDYQQLVPATGAMENRGVELRFEYWNTD